MLFGSGRAEIGQGRGSTSGAAIGGPRRLKISTVSRRSVSGVQLKRSGAGLLRARALAGRNAISGVAPACAARCSRRKLRLATGPWFHHSTAAQLAERSACSVAQAASDIVAGSMHTSRGSARPSPCSAATQGSPGGATQTSSREPSSRRPKVCSQGASNMSSPLADAGNNSSVRPVSGQPPPGSSTSSADQPVGAVGVVGVPALANSPACHSGKPSRGARSASARADACRRLTAQDDRAAEGSMAKVKREGYCT